MTRVEYNNTVFDLLGDATSPANLFPEEHEVQGFENNAETHLATPLLVEQLATVAQAVAARATESQLDALAPCSGDELACGVTFIQTFGRRAFRRPLSQQEGQVFQQLLSKAHATLGYAAAIRLTLEAFLQSPQFLYRVEAPISATSGSGAVQLGAYEMASRLSYFLWNSMPDEVLFGVAETGGLSSAEQIEEQARRMLDHPRARQMVTDFHRQWLGLDRLRAAARDVPSDLELTDAELAESWIASTERYLDDVVWSDSGTVGAVFSSPTVFVDDRLASLYGVPFDGAPGEFVPVTALEERAGILTQPGLLALLAHANQSSPIQRGVFVREHILCDSVPNPPPDVDNSPPDPDPNLTTRERFRVHTENPDCALCHQLIDPIGFGFEAYDQLGRYRTEENGIDIDISGELAHTEEPELEGPFNGAVELSQRLATSAVVRDCLAVHWFRYAMGRIENASDACSLDQVQTAFERAGGDVRELLVALTLSDAFRYRPPLPEDG